ncbi:MAG: undecaprenyl-diphosphate phosphatase [Myxococcaceae bacterium]|nr:undecaprenyl-diphosphate phosphatase [Myxococcaceae bacterium]
MSLLEAAVLGVVQGLTEFLPISSTAHLRIVPALLGWKDPGAAYSAVIQLGTVAAVLVYFAKDIGKLWLAFFAGLKARAPFATVESRLAWCVGLGTLPIGVCGLAFKKSIETSFRSLYVMAISLMVLAVILAVVEKVAAHQRRIEDITVKDGLIIGMWQAVALIPGSSRSGTTLTGALSLGFKREDAARFSFLLSIPATTLAGVSELYGLLKAQKHPAQVEQALTAVAESGVKDALGYSHPSTLALIVGTVVSFVAGWLAIAGLLRLLRTRSTMPFVIYRLVLGALLLVLLQRGVLQP